MKWNTGPKSYVARINGPNGTEEKKVQPDKGAVVGDLRKTLGVNPSFTATRAKTTAPLPDSFDLSELEADEVIDFALPSNFA